ERLMTMAGGSPWLHPGRSGRLCLGPKQVLAEFGELHPRVAKALDLRGGAAVAEIFLDSLPGARSVKRQRPAYAPPALQPVTRDFAFVVAADASAEGLLRAVRGADKAAIVDAGLFDSFTLEDGRRSLAVSVTLQPVERSYTDAEIEALSAKIVAAAAKTGAALRG
ncbi:MAG: phenylalanine--tRNA ligase subunit beta, partial [Alphaproteobacteria bacterium]|nr:phenylalanine--tRNA ligase subunit beta [Alphaproteobacteria bacterium]